MVPTLDMEESVLREGLEIMEAGIANVCTHWHPEGECPSVPRGGFGV